MTSGYEGPHDDALQNRIEYLHKRIADGDLTPRQSSDFRQRIEYFSDFISKRNEALAASDMPASLQDEIRQLRPGDVVKTANGKVSRVSGFDRKGTIWTVDADGFDVDVKPEDITQTQQGYRRSSSPTSAPQVPVEVPPSPSGLSASLSAASSDQRDMQLARIGLPTSALEVGEKIPGFKSAYDYIAAAMMRFSPTLRIFSSGSLVAKRAMGDMAETSLRFTQGERGVTTARGGVPLDRLLKIQEHELTLTNAKILRDKFLAYRGQEQGPLAMQRLAFADARGQAPDKLSFADFKSAVTLASSNGDVHDIPEVQSAAREIRSQVLDPVTKLAQSVTGPDGKPMLSEALEPPKGDKSFFPRQWNKQALAAKYNEAKRVFADWLQNEQAKKAAIQERVGRIHYNLSNSENLSESLEARIERKQEGLDSVRDRQAEVQRLNEFAYKRSEGQSEPLDELRAKIRGIAEKIQPQLDKLQKLREDISAEKDKYPEIRKTDAAFFKMMGATQKLKQGKDIVDTIDNASDIADGLDDAIAHMKGGIQGARENMALARTSLGADDLKTLENARAALSKEISPYTREMNKARRSLGALEDRRVPGARGGAVFETEIRNRGNTLADRASGQSHAIDAMADRLAKEKQLQASLRGELEKEIGGWEGNTSEEAKAALKARDEAQAARDAKIASGEYKGKGERLTGADSAIDRAARTIIDAPLDLTREEHEARAAEIIHRINAAPDGRIPYDLGSGGPQMGPPSDAQQVRGSLNNRDFAIPTSLVKDFIHTDTEHIVAAHLRTALPDIHITDRFGDVEMTDVFRRLNEEYDAKAARLTSEASLTKLDNERKAMNRDIAATRDRLRNTYGWELAKTQPNAARIANAARNYNLIADLGTSVFNRLTDSVNAIYRHGFMNVMADGYLPFVKSLVGIEKDFLPAARDSMHDLGVGVDSAMGHLSHQFGDVVSNYLPASKFERGLAWSADKVMMLNLHGPWTDGIKTVAGTVAASSLLRTAEKVALGTVSDKEVRLLAEAGISPMMAGRIWEAFKGDGGGQTFGGRTHVANTASWTDPQARDLFASAVGRDADMSVLTPGLEKPLWMSGPVVSLLGQYKSFIAAAHEKLLIANLQQMDARTLQGLAASLGMGMLSYRAYTLLSGAPASDRPQDWIKEGISRSAILGWFSELNSMQAKFTGGQTDMFRVIGADHPLSRRATNGALSELLGPTYSKLEGIAGGINDLSHGTWTAQDTHKFRQAMILQNLFAVRRLFDAAEDGFNEHLGIKPLNRDPAIWPGGKPPG